MTKSIIFMGDNKDLGSPRLNLSGLEAQIKHILSTSDSKNTWIVHGGDLVDQHDTSGSRYYDAEASALERLQYHPYEESAQMLASQNIDATTLDDAHKQALYLQTLGQKYTAQALQILKRTTDAGFNLRMITGNNEQHVFTGNQVTPENLEQITEQYRTIAEKISGGQFIDRVKISDVNGLKVFSAPYWAVSRGEDHVENQLYDSPDIETSPAYSQLQNFAPDEEAVLMLHGKPIEGANLGMNTFLNERSAVTWVFHGHEGTPGISYSVNDNGGEIIYVNTNNDPRAQKQFHYKAEIGESGKVSAIVQYQMSFKN